MSPFSTRRLMNCRLFLLFALLGLWALPTYAQISGGGVRFCSLRPLLVRVAGTERMAAAAFCLCDICCLFVCRVVFLLDCSIHAVIAVPPRCICSDGL